MRRLGIALLCATVLITLALGLAWPRIDFFLVTGQFHPIHKIETLNKPVDVKGWSTQGLLLADGRTLPVPHLRALPSNSVALSQVIKRGVEIDEQGRVYGLVRVHHWCGNDPVREHIARVDVSDMLIYLRVGEPDGPVAEADYRSHKPDGTFSEYGWRVGEFYAFESWRTLRNLAQ